MRKKNAKHEFHARSWVKAITFRTLASLTTWALAYWFTGNMTVAVAIGGYDIVIKILLYYFHERAWHLIDWGKVKN